MNNLKYAVAAIALLPSAVWAQEAREQDIIIADVLVTPEKEIVVTANGNRTQRKETGQAISVVDAQTLQTLQTALISDILRTIPSIAIARNGGVGSQTSIFIRGGESSQTLVLIDGVRINDPSSPNAAFDFGALLTGNIDRVEVLRGPNSVIWGSQAIGGVVSVRTQEPADSFTANALAEYGSNNTAQARANIAGTSGIFSGSVGAGYYRTDGISALSAGTEKDGYKNFAANGKLKVKFSDALSLDLRGYYNKGRVEFDDQFGASPNTFPVTHNEQFIGYVGVNFRLFDDRLTSRLSYSRTDISRIGSEPNVPIGSINYNINRLKGAIDRFEYHGTFDIVDAATLNFGIEHERSFARQFFPQAFGGPQSDSAKNTVTSGFGQLTLRPVTGLTLTGGVRYDDYSVYGGQTTFGANFAYTPNGGNTVIRGTYAEGFRAPTLTEALLPGANRALKPETAKSYDLGIEHSFLGGRATASATYFRRNSSNALIFSFDSFQTENVEKTRSKGVEFTLALRPSDRLTLNAQYSLVDAKDLTIGDIAYGAQLARRPKDNASVAVDWASPWGLALGSTVTVTGDSFNTLPNIFAPNPVRLDGFVLASLRASYPVTDRFDLFGRVENLFDAQYETVKGYGTLGRNAYVGVRAKF
jgi:vitamin B12 transporter